MCNLLFDCSIAECFNGETFFVLLRFNVATKILTAIPIPRTREGSGGSTLKLPHGFSLRFQAKAKAAM